MKERITFQGRSLILNIFLILVNLTGLTFLAMGYHDYFIERSTLFKLIGLMLMIFSIGGLILFKGRLMMASVARVLVGGLFIVSGLVKANDPLGFAYKLEEYFEDGALAYRIKEWFGAPGFSLEWMIEYALFLSVLICIAEIVLGVMTIIGGKIKLVSYLMLVMMIFFTFLTWHTANCDKDAKFIDRDTYAMTDPLAAVKMEMAKTSDDVKIISQNSNEVVIDELKSPQCVDDCGCFGDAMKGSVGRSLTPKESLWKDIVLLYLVLWIFMGQWIIQPNNRKQNIYFGATSLLTIVFFSWVFGWYFPIFFGFISIIGALWMLRVGGKFLGNYWGGALIVSIFCLLMTTYVLMYLPLKDYRPYAIGSNLIEKMNDGVIEQNEDMLVYRNTKTGKLKEYGPTSAEYTNSKIWENPDWVYDTMIKHIIVPGRLPSIDSMQFSPFIAPSDVSKDELTLSSVAEQMKNVRVKGYKIYDADNEMEIEVAAFEYNTTDYDPEYFNILDTIEMENPYMSDVVIRDMIVTEKQFVMVVSKDLSEANWGTIDRLKEIYAVCKKNSIPFAVVCGASREVINEFKSKNDFHAPFFVNDGVELKAITRSNPTLMVIEKGVVKAKYPFRSIPNKEEFKTNYVR